MSAISALFGNNDALANLIEQRQRLAASRNQPAVNATAASVKKSISDSNFLATSSKQTLTQLTDTVSKFASDDPKLLRDIVGISNLLQIGQKENTASASSSPYAKLLEGYYANKMTGVNLKIDA